MVRTVKGKGVSKEAEVQFRDALASGLHRGQLDPAEIKPLLAAVLGGNERTAGWGPFGSGVDDLVQWLRATVVAVADVGSFSDGDLYEARARLRGAITDYAISWRGLAADPAHGHMFERPTIEMLMNRACRDLLFTLGVRRVADEEGQELVPVPLAHWDRPPLHLLPVA